VVPRDGYLGMDYGDETLVAILCATPGVPALAGHAAAEWMAQTA
jgi:hypothetical protein